MKLFTTLVILLLLFTQVYYVVKGESIPIEPLYTACIALLLRKEKS